MKRTIQQAVFLAETQCHRPQRYMLIKVCGEQMYTEKYDGDRVMIDRSKEPKPGGIVLAHIDRGYTIKRYKLNSRNGRRGLYFVPANHLMNEREITEDDNCEVVGVVTHLIRFTNGNKEIPKRK